MTREDRLRRLMQGDVAPRRAAEPKKRQPAVPPMASTKSPEIPDSEQALLAVMQADVAPMWEAKRTWKVGEPPRDDYSCGRRGASGANWDTWLRQKPTVAKVRALIASGGGAAEGYERWGNYFRLVRAEEAA